MKLRKPLIILVVMFSGLAFSACTDESENIVPLPTLNDDATATVGDETKNHDPMD